MVYFEPLPACFGSRKSEVQILSPRPAFAFKRSEKRSVDYYLITIFMLLIIEVAHYCSNFLEIFSAPNQLDELPLNRNAIPIIYNAI